MLRKNQKGFTVTEFIIIMAILATLYSLNTLNLVNIKHITSINSSIDTLISDMKQQQIKSMTADTQGRSYADSYGVHFSTDSYTLFHGLTYSNSDPSNFTVNLDQDITFSNISFLNSQIIFASGSGEFTDYSPSTDSITIKSKENTEQKTITINKYGVVTSEE